MSIVHRMTGAALYLGTALLAWWLIAAASGPDAFETVQGFMGSILGRLILFGYTWALIHHMLGGIRHLVWDTGRGLDLATIEIMARVTLGGSIALTLVVWVVGYAVMGG
jgi:succinate dehydrogenase / fumarate reductase cytochrome b subunit